MVSTSDPGWRRPWRGNPIRRGTALLSAAALALALLVGTAGPATAAQSPFTLPAPTGHYPLGTTTLHLVDTSRPDPWVPTIPFRELMVQLWYPTAAITGYPRAPWMSPATARSYEKNNDLPVIDWPMTHGQVGAPVLRHRGGRPVVLYVPGFGDDRESNTVEFEDLASHGYVVATIDYVHDADEVELPDGRLETSALPDDTGEDPAPLSIKGVEAKAADTRFVLDQLTALDHGANPDHEHRPLPAGLPGALDLDHVGVFGHSDGGAATAHLLHVDPRIKVGADFDGNIWTTEARAGSDRPMLLIGGQNPSPTEVDTWATFRRNQRGPALQLRLAGSTHVTFTDLAALVPEIGPTLSFPPERIAQIVGPDGPRAVMVLRSYLNAWFDRYLRDRDSRLLDGPSPRFPEIQFIP